jgi:hypothetical protein
MKAVAAGLTALLVVASLPALAQTQTQNRLAGAAERLGQADVNALTDLRITLIKSALQLTPDQEKLWPPIEDAIRTRAQDREQRVESTVGLAEARRDRGIVESMRNRNPIDFMHRRADNLTQRAEDLNKLADAWQPLYRTLTSEQKRRMGALTVLVIRDLRTPEEQTRLKDQEDEDTDN